MLLNTKLNLLKLYILRFIILLICCSCLDVHAGTRGRVMAFIDISTPPFVDGKDAVIALRRLINVPGKKTCWACAPQNRHIAGISLLYAKKLPDGITYQLVKSSVNNTNTAKIKLQTILAGFKDPLDGAKLDGLYAYEHTDKQLTIYAISAVANEKIGKLTINIKERISLLDLDNALEKAAHTIQFNPSF
jgi:hypothetical protein